MSKKLDGKVAVVTGGSSGIGLATARRFVAEGARVVITGRRQAALDDAVARISGGVTAVRGDVSSLADLDRLYEVVGREHGRIDVLFANAGVPTWAPIGSITEAQFDTAFDTNVRGLLFAVQKALPLVADGGSIILNASVSASKGRAGVSVYSATKAAVRSFARCWAADLRGRRIRVNAVSPGSIDTPFFGKGALPSGAVGAFKASVAATVPLGRMGTPDEVAKAVVFLASDDSSYVTGIELFVDGGAVQVWTDTGGEQDPVREVAPRNTT